MENQELLIEEFEIGTSESIATENGEETTEVSEVVEQSDTTDNEGIEETVSDGDSVVYVEMSDYDEQLNEIINELIEQREDIEGLQEFMEYETQSVFEKPLEDYSVTEGMLLIIMFVVSFSVMFKIIGGIITCKI